MHTDASQGITLPTINEIVSSSLHITEGLTLPEPVVSPCFLNQFSIHQSPYISYPLNPPQRDYTKNLHSRPPYAKWFAITNQIIAPDPSTNEIPQPTFIALDSTPTIPTPAPKPTPTPAPKPTTTPIEIEILHPTPIEIDLESEQPRKKRKTSDKVPVELPSKKLSLLPVPEFTTIIPRFKKTFHHRSHHK
jgi:hypothetical protein